MALSLSWEAPGTSASSSAAPATEPMKEPDSEPEAEEMLGHIQLMAIFLGNMRSQWDPDMGFWGIQFCSKTLAISWYFDVMGWWSRLWWIWVCHLDWWWNFLLDVQAAALWLWPWQDVKVANPFTPKKVQHHHLCGVIPSQTIPLSEAVGFEESHNGSHRDEGVWNSDFCFSFSAPRIAPVSEAELLRALKAGW